jgi:hypothetical protein
MSKFNLNILKKEGRYGGSEKDRGIWYHGTRGRNLKSILSQGLIANPKEKAWAEDSNASFYAPSRASVGGIYLTNNIMTAESSSGKDKAKNETRVIVVIEAQPRSFFADEDNISSYLKSSFKFDGMSQDHSYSTLELFMAFSLGSNPEFVDQARNNYVEKTYTGLVQRLGEMHPKKEARVKQLLYDNWPIVLFRQASYLADNRYDWSSCFFRNISHEKNAEINKKWKEIYNDPNKTEEEKEKEYNDYVNYLMPVPPNKTNSEKAYLDFQDQMTRTLKNVDRRESYNNTSRITEDIGYSGSNRIICIVEIKDTHVSPYHELKVVYGELPDKFIKDWNQRMGSLNLVQEFSNDKEAFNINRIKTAQELGSQYLKDLASEASTCTGYGLRAFKLTNGEVVTANEGNLCVPHLQLVKNLGLDWTDIQSTGWINPESGGYVDYRSLKTFNKIRDQLSENKMVTALNYFDIGHGDGLDVLNDELIDQNDEIWILFENNIKRVSYEEALEIGKPFTHGQIFGESNSKNNWKGRYDFKKDMVSVVPPENYLNSLTDNLTVVPEFLIHQLEISYSNATIHCFYCKKAFNLLKIKMG